MNLTDLPVELVWQMFLDRDVSDIIAVCKVNKALNQVLCKSSEFLTAKFNHDFPNFNLCWDQMGLPRGKMANFKVRNMKEFGDLYRKAELRAFLEKKAYLVHKTLLNPDVLKREINKISIIKRQNQLLDELNNFLEDNKVSETLLQFIAELVSKPDNPAKLMEHLRSGTSFFIVDRDLYPGQGQDQMYIPFNNNTLEEEEERDEGDFPMEPRIRLTLKEKHLPHIIQSIITDLWSDGSIKFVTKWNNKKADVFIPAGAKDLDFAFVYFDLEGNYLTIKIEKDIPEADFKKFADALKKLIESYEPAISMKIL
jgi:hypothetical protein